ncbi:hypothetical protein HMPREF3038_01348 [Akkermansia sp. KLE1797]|nr:hypothetical protein HMPREF3038_01348 [Akkermansia sp. KLE1797]
MHLRKRKARERRRNGDGNFPAVSGKERLRPAFRPELDRERPGSPDSPAKSRTAAGRFHGSLLMEALPSGNWDEEIHGTPGW